MEEFTYYIDRKVTVWDRDTYTIKAKNKEEAEKKAKELFANEDRWFIDSEDSEDQDIVFNGTEVQFDTAEDMSVSANDGAPTVTLEDDAHNQIACNVENECNICGRGRQEFPIIASSEKVLICSHCKTGERIRDEE